MLLRILLLMVLSLLPMSSALACEAVPPSRLWVQENDLNQDAHVDFSEWQLASIGHFKLSFIPGGETVFRALDRNHNGVLTWDKDTLYRDISFSTDPCAGLP